MANALAITLHTQGAETVGGYASAVDIGAVRSAVRVDLRITASVGSFVCWVETSPDGSNGWIRLGTFGGDDPKRARLTLDDCDRYVRVGWTVGTSCTFSVSGYAHTLYATRADLAECIPSTVYVGAVEPSSVVAALIHASSEAEDILATGRPMPLTSWSTAISAKTAAIAAYLVIRNRGFSPDGADEHLRHDCEEARAWLAKDAARVISSPSTQPAQVDAVRASSGNPDDPTTFTPRFSNNWGDFG